MGADYVVVPERTGLVTLRARDAAAGSDGPATVIATDATADFYLTAARDQIVYSSRADSAAAGLYAAPLP
jgi:hypothetical protein